MNKFGGSMHLKLICVSSLQVVKKCAIMFFRRRPKLWMT